MCTTHSPQGVIKGCGPREILYDCFQSPESQKVYGTRSTSRWYRKG